MRQVKKKEGVSFSTQLFVCVIKPEWLKYRRGDCDLKWFVKLLEPCLRGKGFSCRICPVSIQLLSVVIFLIIGNNSNENN